MKKKEEENEEGELGFWWSELGYKGFDF